MSESQDVDKTKELSSREKWILSVLLGILAIICVAPLCFTFSNRIGFKIGAHTMKDGNPTSLGWTIHIVFFIIIVRLLMK